MLIIVAKLSILDVSGSTDCTSAKSATWKCNRKKLQHAKSATGEEYKTRTLQRVKVQHEIVQHEKIWIATVKHGKSAQE